MFSVKIFILIMLLLWFFFTSDCDALCNWRRRLRRRRRCTKQNCNVMSWSHWSYCTADRCGKRGSQSRSRMIVSQPSCGGTACPDNRFETRQCYGSKAVDCELSYWSEWSGCTTPCGVSGTQTRSRRRITIEQCGGTCSSFFRGTRSCPHPGCFNGGSLRRGACFCKEGFSGICCLTKDPPECSNYTELNTADRASGSQRGRLLKCDRNDFPSQAKWYRFTGAAGTRMPTSPVAKDHCGTAAPGWLNGQHPKKEDGVVSQMVCFNWGNNLCSWHVFVRIRNCGNFWVYHLRRTPNCYLRYCGDKGHSPVCHRAMDVGIIMDRSGSVGSADFLKSKSFVKTLVYRFQISFHGTRVGIIAYQSNSHLAVKFSDANSQNPAAMTTIIDKIAYTGGGTRTDIALEMANSGLFSSAGGDRIDKPNVLVVITDGKTNSGSKAYKTVLAPLINNKVRMIAVGVGSGIDYSELNEIANGKMANVIHVDKFEDLFLRLNTVLRASCDAN